MSAEPVPVGHLETTVTRAMGRVVVAVDGELDLNTSVDLRGRLIELIEDEGERDVVIDLRDLAFVDSTGIGVLLGAHRRLRRNGGELTLSSPSPAMREVLAISGLGEVFTITRT
jgi:anti-sigma B factor antagonist